MEERFEIRLSGSGGQGLILAGIILAEAAVVYDGKKVVQTQSYGPEARGGASRAEVIISSEDIDYTKVTCPNLLLSLTQESFNKYSGDLAEGATVIVDEEIDTGSVQAHLIRKPILQVAKEDLGRVLVANIVSLGICVAASKVVSQEAIEKAVLSRVPKGTEELNRRALQTGLQMGS